MIAARVPDSPDSEEIVLVSSTESTITFRWAIPYNGGSPITLFQIWWDSGDKTDNFTPYALTVNPDANFLVEENLVTGVFYAFKLIAVNDVGISEMSNSVTYVAASVPGAPGVPYMTSRSETEISIEWSPALENGSIIHSYDIFEAPNIDTAFIFVGSSSTTSYTATDLTSGNNYKYKIKAVNYAGIGPLGMESGFIVAAVVPEPPVNLQRLYADNEFMTVGWDVPLYNGGTPVYGYKVFWDAGNGACCSLVAVIDHDSLMYTTPQADIDEGVTY